MTQAKPIQDDLWADDRFDRKDDALMLKQWIVARHENTNGLPLVVNLNSGWGGGKTFFLTRFCKDLRSSGFIVANINAWDADFEDDPLPSIALPIFKVLADIQGDSQNGEKSSARSRYLGSAQRILWKSGKGFAKRGLSYFLSSETADEVISELQEFGKEIGSDVIDEVADLLVTSDRQEAAHDFKQAIGELITSAEKASNRLPLIVLVDELDRCRPTYAIAFLERIKHLFDVSNIAFVVATDTEQLQHTIQAVYGAEFNSRQYLKRFFEFTYSFPNPDLSDVIKDRIGDAVELQHETAKDFPTLEFIQALFGSGPIQARDAIQILDTANTIANFFPKGRLILPLLVSEILSFRYLNGDLSHLDAAMNGSSQADLNSGWRVQRTYGDTYWENGRGRQERLLVSKAIAEMRSFKTMSTNQIVSYKANFSSLEILRNQFHSQRLNGDDGFTPLHYSDIVARCGRSIKSDDESVAANHQA